MSKANLESKLKEAGLQFEDTGQFFRGIFNLDDGRSQMFLIDYDADDFQGHQEYDFMSAIGSADDASAVKAACEMAGKKTRGGVVISGSRMWLKYEVGVDWDGDVMVANLNALCVIADEMEAVTVGGDDQ